EADGKITLGGRTAPNRFGSAPVVFPRTRYAMVRLTSSGWLDTTFGTNGWVQTYFDTVSPEDQNHDSQIHALVAQNDGKLIGLGTAGKLIDYEFSAARYNWDNGTIDTAFATQGKSSVAIGGGHDFGLSGMMAPDGKIVLGGYDDIREDFTAVRWQGDSAPTGTQVNAPDLQTAS